MALFPQESKKDLAVLSIGFSHFPQSPKLSLRDIHDSNPSYQPASLPISLTSSPSHRNLSTIPFVVSFNNNGSSKRKIVLSQKKSSSRLKSSRKPSLGLDNPVKYLDLSQMHANNENTDAQRAFMISSAKAIREETPIPTARRQSNMMVLAVHDQSSQRNLNSGMGNMPTEHFNEKFQKKYEHFRRTQNNTLKQYLGKFRSITEIKNRAEGKGNMITVQPAFTRINGDLDIATSRLFSTKKQKTIYLEKKTKELIRIKRRVLDGELVENTTTSKRALPKEDDDFGLNERKPTTEIDTNNYLQNSMASYGGTMAYNNTRPHDTTSLLLDKDKFFNQIRGGAEEATISYQRLPKTGAAQNFYLAEKDSSRKNIHKKTFSLFNYSDALSKYDNSIYQNNLMSAQNSPSSPKQDPLKISSSPRMQAMRSSYDEIQFKKQFQSTDNLLQQRGGQRIMPSPPVQRKMIICKPVAPELVVDVDSPRRAIKYNRVASATMIGHFMASDSVKNKGKRTMKDLKNQGPSEGKTPKSYIVSSSSSKGLTVVTTDLKNSQVFKYEQQESIVESKSADASPVKSALLQSKYKRTGTNPKTADISDQFSDFKLEGW